MSEALTTQVPPKYSAEFRGGFRLGLWAGLNIWLVVSLICTVIYYLGVRL